MSLNPSSIQKGTNTLPLKGILELWRRVIEPSASIQGEEQRRLSRTLASLLIMVLPLIILVGLVLMPIIEKAPVFWQAATFPPAFLAAVVSVIAYGFNRSGRYRIGAAIYIFIFVLSPWWAVVRNGSITILPIAILTIGGVLMASILLPGTSVLYASAIASIAGILLLPLTIPGVSFADIASILSVIATINLIILILSYFQGRLEHERQLGLQTENIDLHESASYSDQRIGELIDTIVGLSSLDFSAQAPIRENGDMFDAVATGLNALGEELNATTVARSYLNDIITSMTDSLIVVTPDEEIQTINRAAMELLGYSEKELIGQKIGKLFSSKNLEKIKGEEFTQAGIKVIETALLNRKGDEISVLLSSSVLYGASGLNEGAVYVAHNTSTRVRAQKLLQTLNNAAMSVAHVQLPEEIFVVVGEEFKKLDISCSVFLADNERRVLFLKHHTFNSKAVQIAEEWIGVKAGNFPIPFDAMDDFRKVIETRQAGYIDDVVPGTQQILPKPFKKFASQIVQKLNLPKSIISPLIVEDDFIGILAVHSGGLIPDDVPAVMAFANQISAVWRKVSLMRDLERSLEEIKAAEAELIQHRDHLEELVMLRTEELQAVNTELSNFAYVASHDLKAPLRAISQLSSWIIEDYSGVLDEAGREKLQMLIDRTKHMHNLIDGILQYSRIGRVAEKSSRIDLNTIVSNLIKVLDPPSTIHITIESKLPIMVGESTYITQVFQNLLSNAIRYIDKPQGYIRIDCESTEREWRFSITDNGPGIDERYFDKIFQIFQTLGMRKDVDSTGIGLALVKRIVEKWEGRIWVESTIGHGSTFFFTMPKNRSEA